MTRYLYRHSELHDALCSIEDNHSIIIQDFEHGGLQIVDKTDQMSRITKVSIGKTE